jgi:hypothetical protein
LIATLWWSARSLLLMWSTLEKGRRVVFGLPTG